ncbi:HAD family hydrolase [Streptomyces sp. NPDC052396]|uniref:HAD family hydrolase n=1 Tax=Streptomyces sp. NPDC052396 TaxID=3365689 RepID=UPI0037CFD186
MTSGTGARLVLWDIDQTLIEGGGVSREAYAAAFTRVTGQRLVTMAEMAGRTELAIATDTLRLNGVAAEPALVQRVTAALVEELTARAGQLAAVGRALPGAAESLAALAGLPGVHQSVLTGNVRALAELKLGVFGLIEHLDFDCGAYGDDAPERTALLGHAWQRALALYGRAYAGHQTVIVGDTVRDMAVARHGGALAVAVATGRTSAAELAAAGADVVLPDLADVGAVVAAVMGR